MKMYVVFYWEVSWFNIMDKSIVASQKSMQNMRSTAYMFILYISNHEQQKPEIQNLSNDLIDQAQIKLITQEKYVLTHNDEFIIH